jgi:hypothetical protein
MGQCLVRVEQTFDQNFDLSARLFVAEQTGAHHLGVVEDQQVMGFEQAGQIGEHPIAWRGLRTFEHQQTRT